MRLDISMYRNVVMSAAAVAILGGVIFAQQEEGRSTQEIFDAAMAEQAAGEALASNVMSTDINLGDPVPTLEDGNTCVYDATGNKRQRPIRGALAVPRRGGSAVRFNKCAILPSGTYDILFPSHIAVFNYRPGSGIGKNINKSGKNIYAVPFAAAKYTEWFRASLRNKRVQGPIFGQEWMVVAHPDISEGLFRGTLQNALFRDMRQKIISWESSESAERAAGVLALKPGEPNTSCIWEKFVCTGAEITFDPDATDWEFWLRHQVDELSFRGQINDGSLSDDVGTHGSLKKLLAQKRKRRLHGRIPRGARWKEVSGSPVLVYPSDQNFTDPDDGGGGGTFDFDYPPKNTLVKREGLIFRAPGRKNGYYASSVTMPAGNWKTIFAEVQFVQAAWPELGSNKRQRILTLTGLIHSWAHGPRGLTGNDGANLANHFRGQFGPDVNTEVLELPSVNWKLGVRYRLRYKWSSNGTVSLHVLGPNIDRKVTMSGPKGTRRIGTGGQTWDFELGFPKEASSNEPYSPKGSSWYDFALGGTQ